MSTTVQDSPDPNEVPSSDSADSQVIDTVAVEDTQTPGEDVGEIEIEVEGGEVEAVAEEPDELAVQTAKVEELDKKNKDTYDRLLRSAADMENLRKRSRREVADARVDEQSRVLKEMLPVIDNLERAVNHAQQTESEATKGIIEGVTLVMRQFGQALERFKVKSLEAKGKPFDPALHEAVSQAPSADHPAGTVLEVLQTGYTIGDRLLRPAMAVVSIPMPEPVQAEPEPETDAVDAEVETESAEAED